MKKDLFFQESDACTSIAQWGNSARLFKKNVPFIFLFFLLTSFCMNAYGQTIGGGGIEPPQEFSPFPTQIVGFADIISDPSRSLSPTSAMYDLFSVPIGTQIRIELTGYNPSKLSVRWFAFSVDINQWIDLDYPYPVYYAPLGASSRGDYTTYKAVVSNSYQGSIGPNGSFIPAVREYFISYLLDRSSSPWQTPVGSSSISVYPNPAHNLLTIQGLSTPSTSEGQNAMRICLYNGDGALVRTLRSQEQSCQMDVSGLKEGKYILRIEENGILTETRHIQIKR